MIEIKRISNASIYSLENMSRIALSEGYQFVQRAMDEWLSGQQRFLGKGEGLWGIYAHGNLIGIGGLSRDSYRDDEEIGRVRHLYILPQFRNQGYGKQMAGSAPWLFLQTIH